MTDTATYVPGRVAWEDTYTDAFPDGIPCMVLARPDRDYGGDYPEPLMTEDVARKVTAAFPGDASYVAYAWFGDVLVEYLGPDFSDGENGDVAIVGPNEDGLYAIGHGLLWETMPNVRYGLCRFGMERAS